MPREEQTIGGCPQCQSEAMMCKYNLFENDDLRIDSWEHRCPDCGFRDTTAYRSDDEDSTRNLESGGPMVCPYCGREAKNQEG